MSGSQDECGVACPGCGEHFSRREGTLRDRHMLEKHQSYLRWECVGGTYITNTHRRHDHLKHWSHKHFGEPQPPKPILLPQESEDERQEEIRRRRRSSQERQAASLPTRTSPRKSRRDSPGKRPRHPSSPASKATPAAKRRSSSRIQEGRRTATDNTADISRSSSAATPRADRRSPRKAAHPRRIVRQEGSPSKEELPVQEASTSRTTRAPSASPVPGPSSVRDPEPELELYPRGDSSFEDPEDQRARTAHGTTPDRTPPATPRTSSPASPRCSTERVVRWSREASLEDCRTVRAALDAREAALSKESAPGPAQPVQWDTPEASLGTLVWHPPGAGVSVSLELRRDHSP